MRDDMTSGRLAEGQVVPAEARATTPGSDRAGPGAVRRRSPGPRPVRPAVARVAVRPGQPTRPVCRALPVRPGTRLPVRRSAPRGPGLRPAPASLRVPIAMLIPFVLRERLRRVLAGVAVTLATAAVVVGLGVLAGVAGGSRIAEGPAPAPGGQAIVVSTVQDAAVQDAAVLDAAVLDAAVLDAAVRDLTVTVGVGPAGTPPTVWDVARVVAPAAEGPELAAVVERIVAANSLPSVLVLPGQVLRVPLG